MKSLTEMKTWMGSTRRNREASRDICVRGKRPAETEGEQETARVRLTTEERKRKAETEGFQKEAKVRQEGEEEVHMQEDGGEEVNLKADEVMGINWITASDF